MTTATERGQERPFEWASDLTLAREVAGYRAEVGTADNATHRTSAAEDLALALDEVCYRIEEQSDAYVSHDGDIGWNLYVIEDVHGPYEVEADAIADGVKLWGERRAWLRGLLGTCPTCGAPIELQHGRVDAISEVVR